MYDIIEGTSNPQAMGCRGRADNLAAEGIDESGLPAQSYVPNSAGQPPASTAGAGVGQGYSTTPGGVPLGGAGLGGQQGVSGVPGQGNKTVFDAGAQ
jgi:hypothetical protein